MMKYLLHTLSCLLLFAAGTCLAQTPGHTLRSGGIDRTYRLHLPEGLPDGAPLVIVLHGYGGQGDPERFDMNRVADRHGFAVCYPQGERDGRGKTCWNVGYPFQADMAVDDVRFLSELIRHLQKKHGLSRRNVFCTGMSNGGDMCYLLASRCPETYAALGPVAGFMSVEILRSDRNPHPIPLFEIHGTEDRTTRWEGDLGNEGGWAPMSPSRPRSATGPPRTNASQSGSTPCPPAPAACRSSPTATRRARTETRSGSTRPSAESTPGKRRA